MSSTVIITMLQQPPAKRMQRDHRTSPRDNRRDFFHADALLSPLNTTLFQCHSRSQHKISPIVVKITFPERLRLFQLQTRRAVDALPPALQILPALLMLSAERKWQTGPFECVITFMYREKLLS
jgi:hypothetical protein